MQNICLLVKHIIKKEIIEENKQNLIKYQVKYHKYILNAHLKYFIKLELHSIIYVIGKCGLGTNTSTINEFSFDR